MNNNNGVTSSAEEGEGDGYSNLYKDDENPKDLLAASSSISDAPQAAEPPLVKVSQNGNVTPAPDPPRRKWSPFPASSPTEGGKEIDSNNSKEDKDDSDFASMLKQASTKLSHQNEDKVEEVPEKAPWKKVNSGPLSPSTYDDIAPHQSSKDYPQIPNDHSVMMTNIEKLTNITSPDDEASNITYTLPPTLHPYRQLHQM